MLRVHSNSVLVVPPFECAWLTGEEFLLRDGRGCISFEVKGDNDVTILLKPQAGSRRWQHAVAGPAGPLEEAGRTSPVESNYTVILGSHRNSCLKFEKDGEICCMVNDVPGARLSSSSFTKFWLNYNNGSITVGSGDPGSHTFYRWTDPDPDSVPPIRHAGLSAWDKHVAYRNIRILPAIDPTSTSPRDSLASPDQASCVPSLLDTCAATLHESLSENSVCAVLAVCDCLAPVAEELRGHALEYLARHFQAVVAADLEGLCELGVPSIADLLRSDCLVCGEKAVFEAVMAWAGYGRPVADSNSVCRPLKDVEEVLPLVRFPLMSDAELQEVRGHPMGERTLLLRELVSEAQEARVDEASKSPKVQQLRGPLSVQDKRHVRALGAREAAASARFQRRHSPGCTELIYMYDGDHNGVCRFLGTAYGRQEWVNPVLAGRVQVRSSSPSCRFTDPRALLSGNFLPNNFAGPRLEAGQLASWWVLDLGEGHSLVPNYYTLRHDGSLDFLRNWVLQGSNDGESWVDLRRHIDDRRITKPGQYASWPVTGHASSLPYRFFRVLLIGPNPQAQNPRHVCLSYIELYGYFYAAHKAAAAAAAAAGGSKAGGREGEGAAGREGASAAS